MRHRPLFAKAAVLALLFSASLVPVAFAQTSNAVDAVPAKPASVGPITNPPELCPPGYTGKTVFIPARIDRVPQGNDFNNNDSQFSYKRSKSTDNFVLFWDKTYGDDPMTNANVRLRFDVDAVLKEADRFYNFYIDDMHWVNRTNSYATKTKFLFIVFYEGNNGTAYGGSVENNHIGAFWTPATRIHEGPYGVVAHELGHSFQALTAADYGSPRFSGGGAIAETTSQWMLWQVYDWLSIETGHLNTWMRATHLAFLHEAHQYDTAAVLEYWSEKRGLDIIGKLWREVQRGEDPAMTYKRLEGLNQSQFDDEMFEADRHFVTWDLPRIEKQSAKFADQHTTSIMATNDGYQIGWTNAPQNYGYNAIKLKVPPPGTKVTVDFKGIEGAEGYKIVHPELAGWRYGFVAHKADDTRLYSDIYSQPTGTAEITVPDNTKFLWFVVTGAPTEHFIHTAAPRGGGGGGGRRRGNGNNGTNALAGGNRGGTNAPTAASGNGNGNAAAVPPDNSNEQWPYFFKITGTTPDDSIVHAATPPPHVVGGVATAPTAPAPVLR
jgi:hypothetical protein